MRPPKVRPKIAHILRVTYCRMTLRFCNWQVTEWMCLWCEPLREFSISIGTKSFSITVLVVVRWPKHRRRDSVVYATTTGIQLHRQSIDVANSWLLGTE